MTPWNKFLKNLADIVQIKAIITLVIVFTLCIQVVRGKEIGNEFIILAVTAIFNYYFPKNGAKENKDSYNELNEKHEIIINEEKSE
jgi:uncharacterized membrane protein YfbV (UPF0208 family)